VINSLTTSIEVHDWVAHESKPSYKALLKAGAIQKQSRRPRVPEPWKGDPTLAQGETLVVDHKSMNWVVRLCPRQADRLVAGADLKP